MADTINFGDKVEDVVSNFSGIVIGKYTSIDGITKYEIQPQANGAELKSSRYFSESRLEKIDGGIHIPKTNVPVGFSRSTE